MKFDIIYSILVEKPIKVVLFFLIKKEQIFEIREDLAIIQKKQTFIWDFLKEP